MSILKIHEYPDPILKKKTENVEKSIQDLAKLTADMTQTMQKADGVGLAGPQVGISKKIFVVQTEQGPSVFFNPKILKKSGKKVIEEEGCLSLPGIFLKVKRSEKIEIEAQNLKFEKVRISAEGMLARIFQHEIDHLNGVLIIDKIPFWRRWKLKKTLNLKKLTNL